MNPADQFKNHSKKLKKAFLGSFPKGVAKSRFRYYYGGTDGTYYFSLSNSPSSDQNNQDDFDLITKAFDAICVKARELGLAVRMGVGTDKPNSRLNGHNNSMVGCCATIPHHPHKRIWDDLGSVAYAAKNAGMLNSYADKLRIIAYEMMIKQET